MSKCSDITKYERIIDHPHHVSLKHTHMPLPDRAAQFSPFAALVGYDDAVEEAALKAFEEVIAENTNEKAEESI
ncbi:MAG: hypothetical protein K6E68_04835 [Lachnospiraceae bacterium]|nr:hypothetical protein [Lachnospiraceae bacterium]